MKMPVLLICFSLSTTALGQEKPPETIQQQAHDARRRLAEIDYRHSRDLSEYIAKMKQVKLILPTLEAFYEWSDTEQKRLRASYAGRPDLVRLADFFASVNAIDKAGEIAVREEVGLAAQMSELPWEKRQSFFDSRIRPIENIEDGLVQQEIDLAADAKKNGVILPPFVDNPNSN